MKRMIAVLLTALLVLSLCACGSNVTVTGSSGEEPAATAPVSLDELKTMGDALAIGKDSQTLATWNDWFYIYCFMMGGTPVRVMADLDEELYNQVEQVIFSGDEDAEDQLAELLSPLPLSSVEDLSDSMLSEKDLSKLIGKTGKELLEDDWFINGSYWTDDDGFVVLMDNDIMCYQIVFDGEVEQGDDFDVEEGIQDLTVKSASFFGLGDACTDVDLYED